MTPLRTADQSSDLWDVLYNLSDFRGFGNTGNERASRNPPDTLLDDLDRDRARDPFFVPSHHVSFCGACGRGTDKQTDHAFQCEELENA